MKTRILLSFLSLLFFLTEDLSAQNWEPVVQGTTYNYVHSANDRLFTSIWIDSTKEIKGQTVSYLNTVIRTCENCDYKSFCNALGGMPPTYLNHQPQFLQKELIKKDQLYWFRDTSSFVLKTLGRVDDSWLYDTTLNITATITKKEFQSVLGISDSIKVIRLSNQDTIIVSKNFGIIQFPSAIKGNPSFKLAGAEGKNVGKLRPKMKQFFELNVGDLFEYHSSLSSYTGGTTTTIRKYEIVSKQVKDDSLTYTIKGYKRSQNNYGQNTFVYEAINEKLIVVDSVDHLLNQLPKRIDLTSFSECDFLWADYTLDAKRNLYVGDGRGGHFYASDPSEKSDTIIYKGQYSMYTPSVPTGHRYSPGLGIIYTSYGSGGTGFIEDLVAYRKGDDTTGVFTATRELTNGIREQQLISYSLFPNPATSQVNLVFEQNHKGTIEIKSMEGKVIYQKSFSGDQFQVDTSAIPNGIYLLSISTDNSSGSQKLSILK